MKNSHRNKKGGVSLISTIIIIVIIIAILSWYGFDIKDFFTSPQAQKNFGYVWNFISDIWSNYLAGPVIKLWSIIVQLIGNHASTPTG